MGGIRAVLLLAVISMSNQIENTSNGCTPVLNCDKEPALATEIDPGVNAPTFVARFGLDGNATMKTCFADGVEHPNSVLKGLSHPFDLKLITRDNEGYQQCEFTLIQQYLMTGLIYVGEVLDYLP